MKDAYNGPALGDRTLALQRVGQTMGDSTCQTLTLKPAMDFKTERTLGDGAMQIVLYAFTMGTNTWSTCGSGCTGSGCEASRAIQPLQA